MNNLDLLIKKREILKEQIVLERVKVSHSLDGLIKERVKINNAISRAKNYIKTKELKENKK